MIFLLAIHLYILQLGPDLLLKLRTHLAYLFIPALHHSLRSIRLQHLRHHVIHLTWDLVEVLIEIRGIPL